jgi:spermidine/putrescine transport system substrate-binding protein
MKGKILMSSNSAETIGMALKVLGYSMNSSKRSELKEARELLLKQAPYVKAYSAIATDLEDSQLVSGEIVALVTYSGDALMMKEFNQQVEYVLPEEGGIVWADFLCLSSNAAEPELAVQFLNFINTARNAAQNAEYLYLATPHQEALKLLPEAFLNDPIVFPDKQKLSRSENYNILTPRTKKFHNKIMEQLRSAQQNGKDTKGE